MLNTRIGYLALFSALFISGIAIYFSVAGLAAIFSAYAISIIVMGTAIELGKLAGIVWLHHNWHDKSKLLKSGLSILIVGVMFLTSMGIFGYLSKSHVEQTARSQESVSQVQRIDTEIARYTSVISRSEQKIRGFEDNGSGVDVSLNGQIDKEQARIDTAYDRVKPVIQVQLDIIAADEVKIESRTTPYQVELTSINQQLTDLQTALSNKQIKTAQGIVGTQPDGSYGSKTQAAIKEFRTRNEARRDTILEKIDSIRGTPSAAAGNAQQEINRIRASAQNEIDESNATIKNLRSRMGKASDNDIETLLTKERAKIKDSNVELDNLIESKYILEASYRKLEAEVGPLKYIAEFAYDTKADAALLERAVQWLIILIIFIFDPFAVLLLIAAQHSFDRARQDRKAHRPDPEHILEELLNDYEAEPVMPENEIVHDYEENPDWEPMPGYEEIGERNHNHEWGEIPTYSDYFPDEEEIIDDIANERAIDTVKIDYPTADFDSQIKSGPALPEVAERGAMFILTNVAPAQLFISTGDEWHPLDKNLLNHSAYSHEYIKALIKQVGNGTYKPELLNEAEKKHIEELLGRK